VIEPNDNEQRSKRPNQKHPRETYPKPIPESAQVKPRTHPTRVRQRAIERTVFPSVWVASESPRTRFRSRTFPSVTQTTGMKKVKEA